MQRVFRVRGEEAFAANNPWPKTIPATVQGVRLDLAGLTGCWTARRQTFLFLALKLQDIRKIHILGIRMSEGKVYGKKLAW